MRKIILFCLTVLIACSAFAHNSFPKDKIGQTIRQNGISPLQDYFIYGDRTQVRDRVELRYIPTVPSEYQNVLAVVLPSGKSLLPIEDFSPYHQEGEKVQQYLDLSSLGAVRNTRKTNLCGFLVVRQIVQKPLDIFFQTLSNKTDWVGEYVRTANAPINQYQVQELLKAFGYEATFERAYQPEKCPKEDTHSGVTLCVLRGWLARGYVIALANLDKETGLVLSRSYRQVTSNTPHWFLILQVIDSDDGNIYIRIYNPFQNREEIYFWPDFYATWQANRDAPDINIVVQSPPAPSRLLLRRSNSTTIQID